MTSGHVFTKRGKYELMHMAMVDAHNRMSRSKNIDSHVDVGVIRHRGMDRLSLPGS